MGLHLNPSKCEWSWLNPNCDKPCPILLENADEDAQVKLIPTSEIQMLGVPLGSFEFVDEFVKKKLLGKLDTTMLKLVEFEDSQAALFLLRMSYSIIRAVHFMRTTPLTLWRDQAVVFDAKVRDTAESIIGRPMSDRVYVQASLTPTLGGLGLRKTVEHADGAFAASWHESRGTAGEVWVRPASVPEAAASQQFTSLKFDEARHKWLLDTAPNDREFQRLSRVAQPHACGFITAIPSNEDGYDTIFEPRNFRTAIQYRLGIPVVDSDSTCPMCTQPIDIFGDHAVCCTKAGDLIVRHNNLRNLVDSIASDGLLSPVMEKKGILGPTSGRRPGDVTIPIWKDGKGLAIDVAVTSSLNKSNVRIIQPCEDYAEFQKHKKYDVSFEGVPYLFSPLVFETLGAINHEGSRILSQLFRFAAKRLGREFSSFCGRGWARVSCNLQRSVSQAILNRVDGRASRVPAPVPDVGSSASVPLGAIPLTPATSTAPSVFLPAPIPSSSSCSSSPSSTPSHPPNNPSSVASSNKRCSCSSGGSSSCSSCSNRSGGGSSSKGSNKNNSLSPVVMISCNSPSKPISHSSPQTPVCSPGVSALPNSASSSCSSGSKDERERSTLTCVARHQSMRRGTSHSNMRNYQAGEAGRRGYKKRPERKSYNTTSLSHSLSSLHCSPSHCNLVSVMSLSPHLQSPTYTTYAKADDTVYSKVGGSLAEGRQSHFWSRNGRLFNHDVAHS